MTTTAKPLTVSAYQQYGSVIAARLGDNSRAANMGTAERFDFLAPLENTRPGAKANLCVFHCTPQLVAPEKRFTVKLLEKHRHSTQVFVPLGAAKRYLVIVCLGDVEPDLSTLGAFVANGSQGITYKPGVWHHPLIAMDQPTDFACVVWEDGSADDCDVRELARPVIVEI